MMKNAIIYLTIFFKLLPEIRKLIVHIMAELPKDDHVAAAKHAVRTSKGLISNQEKHAPSIVGLPRYDIEYATRQRKQEKDFEQWDSL